ncbi:MAG: hypothetical protein AAF525_17975 [Pseudomonadota bacterium]
MSNQETPTPTERDWRIWAGSAISILWISGGLVYIIGVTGWEAFWRQGSDALGSFLEGAFAPLAFLWLVIGMFIQQKELARNTDQLRHTNELTQKQTTAIAATELNARQETFFKIAENVHKQLSNIAGMLLLSSKGPAGDETFSDSDLAEFWGHHTMGDHEFFSRKLLTIAARDADVFVDLFYATDIRTNHTRNFMRNYRRLLKLASECDVENVIVDSMKDTAHGLLFRQMRAVDPELQTPETAAPTSAERL